MSDFQTIAALTDDVWWQARIRACSTQHAGTPAGETTPATAALAAEVQTGGSNGVLALTRIIAAFPGLAAGTARPDGTVDQSAIDDPTILAQVQANWPVVAGLFYTEDGSPK